MENSFLEHILFWDTSTVIDKLNESGNLQDL